EFLHLVDLDDRTAAFPAGLELGIDVTVVENALDHALLRVDASGILPFGHLLAIEAPLDLRGLGDSGAPSGPLAVAATVTIASAQPDATKYPQGAARAEWSGGESGVLTAAFPMRGDGEIGRFAPIPPAPGTTRSIVLDTSSQSFPLLDGSTPDAPPGLVVT